MEKNEGSCSILRRLNLEDVENVVSEIYIMKVLTGLLESRLAFSKR